MRILAWNARKKNEVFGLTDGFYNLVLTKLRLYVKIQGNLKLLYGLVADIDNFKTVNGSNGGHPAGDYVLAELGGIIRKQFRGDDIPVRNGGDEFVIAELILCFLYLRWLFVEVLSCHR